MKISQQGLDLLIAREGKRNDAYRDSVGVWTIGVGHTGPEVHEGLHWTDEQIADAFRKDIGRFEKSVNDCVRVTLEQFQFDALVSFAFNCGTEALPHGGNGGPSGILRSVNARDFEMAARAFDNWHIPPEITSRRNGEREQFKGAAFEPTIP